MHKWNAYLHVTCVKRLVCSREEKNQFADGGAMSEWRDPSNGSFGNASKQVMMTAWSDADGVYWGVEGG